LGLDKAPASLQPENIECPQWYGWSHKQMSSKENKMGSWALKLIQHTKWNRVSLFYTSYHVSIAM